MPIVSAVTLLWSDIIWDHSSSGCGISGGVFVSRAVPVTLEVGSCGALEQTCHLGEEAAILL